MTQAVKPDGRCNNSRPKGSINKRSEKTIKKAEKGGIMPVPFLLKQMRNGKLDLSVRMSAATSAAPYLHAKIQAIAISGAVTLSHEQALKALDD